MNLSYMGVLMVFSHFKIVLFLNVLPITEVTLCYLFLTTNKRFEWLLRERSNHKGENAKVSYDSLADCRVPESTRLIVSLLRSR